MTAIIIVRHLCVRTLIIWRITLSCWDTIAVRLIPVASNSHFFCIHSSYKCQAYSMVQWSQSKIFTLTTILHKFSITGVTTAMCDMNGSFKSLHESEIMVLLLAKNTEARCWIGPKSHVDCISPREKGDRVSKSHHHLSLFTSCTSQSHVRGRWGRRLSLLWHVV